MVSWSFAGGSSLLHVEARPTRGRWAPPSFAVRLPPPLRGRLRVNVGSGRGGVRGGSSFLNVDRVTEPLAPGAPILVGDGAGTLSAGIAAVVTISDAPYLVTCGHVFTDGGPNVFALGDPEPMAVLSVTYLENAKPIDAAICAITDHGRDLLFASRDAGTWFQRCVAPSPALNGKQVAFWPTNGGGRDPVETMVSSFRASSNVLFGGAPRDGFVEVPFGVSPGDSGSMLGTIDDEMVGLCSGQLEQRWSLFTPLSVVIDRLTADYGKVTLWNPEDAG